jgi:hypothetical protein
MGYRDHAQRGNAAMATSTVEDYLKTLYGEQQRAGGELVPMGVLASSMNVTPAPRRRW